MRTRTRSGRSTPARWPRRPASSWPRSGRSTSSSSPPTTRARCCGTPQECRSSGTPFAADPSQTLTFLDGAAITSLVDGATWLFTNAYEAGLVREKTGLTDDQVLELVGTRVTTHGAKGVVITRAGEPELRIPVAPARAVAEPTGVGDAFRAGFLTATGWGLGLERSAQVGAQLATYVVETVGTQEYAFTADGFAERLARVLRRGRRRGGPARTCRADPHQRPRPPGVSPRARTRSALPDRAGLGADPVVPAHAAERRDVRRALPGRR